MPAFADEFWSLFENDEHDVRFTAHRLNEVPASLVQLGHGAKERIRRWPIERRIEFLHAVAANPDNFDFVEEVAASDSNPKLRAAGISALIRHYPASLAGFNAWLLAPDEVRFRADLVGYISENLKGREADEKIRLQVSVVAAVDLLDEVRLRLAEEFPDVVRPSVIDIALAQLREKASQRSVEPTLLLNVLKVHAPDKLLSMATEHVTHPKGMPPWAADVLAGASSEAREAAFECAWNQLLSSDAHFISAELIGPLAAPSQTLRSVDTCLKCAQGRSGLADTEQRRFERIRDLLSYAPGNDVLQAVMKLGVKATYEQSVVLVELLYARVACDEGGQPRANPWAPTVEQFREVFAIFGGKRKPGDDLQDKLFVHLASIASFVSPEER